MRVCVCVSSDWTKRGVQIPLADGMDFIEEVVEYHNVSLLPHLRVCLYILCSDWSLVCVLLLYMITQCCPLVLTAVVLISAGFHRDRSESSFQQRT